MAHGPLMQRCILHRNGKSLLEYSVDAALRSKWINKTVVSTDDPKILKQAKILKVKNIVVTSKKHYEKIKMLNNKKKIHIYNSLNVIKKIF